MAAFSFFTIKTFATGRYKEKGSEFIALAYPAQSLGEIRDILSSVKKEYFDARHHCYAYRLGADGSDFRANDDGEPNHSAGDPILGQIRSKNLTNVLVIVVRYFGGIKLGTSGLITAYKSATAEALNSAKIQLVEVTEAITITYPYTATPEVMRLVKDFDLVIEEQVFNEGCSGTFRYKLRDKLRLSEKIQTLHYLSILPVEMS